VIVHRSHRQLMSISCSKHSCYLGICSHNPSFSDLHSTSLVTLLVDILAVAPNFMMVPPWPSILFLKGLFKESDTTLEDNTGFHISQPGSVLDPLVSCMQIMVPAQSESRSQSPSRCLRGKTSRVRWMSLIIHYRKLGYYSTTEIVRGFRGYLTCRINNPTISI
jgi:hypothetical protein